MKLFFIILLFFSPVLCISQNLIANGGFEDENICTEYKVACAPESWLGNTGGFKNYINDPQFAFSGNYCLAIEAGRTRNKYQRTYTRTQLLCNLRNGKQYRLDFFAKTYSNILDSIGVYFTSYDFMFEKKLLYEIIPSVYIIDQNKPRKDTNWQKISLLYTATGDEKYFTIANFSKRDINGETGVANENHFYVFIDAVSLKPVDPKERTCLGWQKAKADIYAQNDRHGFLDRYVRFYRTQNKWATPPELSLTQFLNVSALTIPDEYFAPGKPALQKTGYLLLDSFCNGINRLRTDSLIVEGNADIFGDTTSGNRLASQRIAVVSEYIKTKAGLTPKQIVTRNLGHSNPVADNTTLSGKQQNRRVELLYYSSE